MIENENMLGYRPCLDFCEVFMRFKIYLKSFSIIRVYYFISNCIQIRLISSNYYILIFIVLFIKGQ